MSCLCSCLLLTQNINNLKQKKKNSTKRGQGVKVTLQKHIERQLYEYPRKE